MLLDFLLRAWTRRMRPNRQIVNPTVGFIYLNGEEGRLLAEQDRCIVMEFFPNTFCSNGPSQNCDIAFLYCKLDLEGNISNSKVSLQSIAKTLGAKVLIVALANDPSVFPKALSRKSEWVANIALVIDRRDHLFTSFVQNLFRLMLNGKSMLSAWVTLAPQNPRLEHKDTPALILSAAAGDISFRQLSEFS